MTHGVSPFLMYNPLPNKRAGLAQPRDDEHYHMKKYLSSHESLWFPAHVPFVV